MNFYTYLWLREDGTPYYVGKGRGHRAFRKGSPPKDRVLIQEFPSETDAFEAEKFLIAHYGRRDLGKGCLINLTDGGDGRVNVKISEETRQRLRDSHKGIFPSEESRRKRGATLRGRVRSAEWCERISLAKRGSKNPNFRHGRRIGAHARSRVAGQDQ